MDEFIDRLPIRVAALSGLLVGSVSLYGGTSLLGCAERIGVAMVVFGLLASVLRILLKDGGGVQKHQVEHRGRHLDTTMPGMTAEDLGFGDRGEIS